MSWSTIRAKIKAKLDTLVPATLGSVYNGEQNPQAVEFSAWPAAELVRNQTEPDYFTNREDIQTYIFAINLYRPLTGDDWATQEMAMDDVVDAVMQAFLDDASLTGTVNGRIMPIQNGGTVVSWNGQSCRKDVILLRCRQITAMA